MFVFPPQNFHPSCFEDYKNVSFSRIKALNPSSSSQTFDLLFVSTVVVHRSHAVAQQGAHRSSAEHLREDRSGRHFFLRRLCHETGSGVWTAGSENRGGFNRCAIRANGSVTLLLLPHSRLCVKNRCFYRAEDQSSATSTWIHFCIWILCDRFRWSVPELNLFKKREGFVAFV